MSKQYDPLQHSVVQAVYGTWSQFEADDFVEALFEAIITEIKRVHWNVFQHSWDATWHGDEVEDPEIPGIGFVRYYCDRCDCAYDDGRGSREGHEDSCIGVKPNFTHEDVQIRWYKWPGRGMSTNKNWSAEEWRNWFNRCLKTVRDFDGDPMSERSRKRKDKLRAAFYKRYPKLAERYGK